MHESVHSHFRLSSSTTAQDPGGVTIRPYSQALSSPSTSTSIVGNGNLRSSGAAAFDPLAYSTTSAGGAGGTTTFHGGGATREDGSASMSSNSTPGSSVAEEDDSFQNPQTSHENQQVSSRKSTPPITELAAANCVIGAHRVAPPPPQITPFNQQSEYEMRTNSAAADGGVLPGAEKQRSESYSFL